MPVVFLALVSFASWFISTLAGGGSPLLLIPLVNFLLGSQALAPTITTGMLLGNSQRIFMFWRHINWTVTFWYLPGAIVGAVVGAYAFTKIHLDWLQLLIGVFLMMTVFSFGFGKKERIFTVRSWYFLPAGFVYAFVSGIIGSSGPVMNPLYLNYGLVKEEMIATKSANVVVVHIAKMVTYAALGALTPEYLGYGLVIGLAAVPANYLGQYVLSKMSEQQFRQVVLATMAISGALMVWGQRDLMSFW
ncbi:MAG: sulfite exporter TauE/SafE family protein [Microcoleus vaginatus WJT46-NPBG5]|nr:sulfite exporter TauE/SafE family protein [Microcoleus vaginatus WJT46-NPBG5]